MNRKMIFSCSICGDSFAMELIELRVGYDTAMDWFAVEIKCPHCFISDRVRFNFEKFIAEVENE